MTFVEVYEEIKRANKDGGLWKGAPINVLGAACQLFHEASTSRKVNGKRVLVPFGSVLAVKYNNFAGIKCTPSWINKQISISNGLCKSLKTDEFISGKWIRGQSLGFRVYNDFAHFLQDYSRLLQAYYNPSPGNVWLFLGGLCGVNRSRYCWATGPAYFASLSKHVVSFGKQVLGPEWKTQLEGSLAKAAPQLTARVPALEVSMAQCAKVAIERG